MNRIVVPELGPATRAVLVRWQVDEGDAVGSGESVALLDAAGTTVEVAATSDGIVVERLVRAGEPVRSGQPIAVLNRVIDLRRSSAARHPAALTAASPPPAVLARPAPIARIPGTPPSRGEAAVTPLRPAGSGARDQVSLLERSAREVPHYYAQRHIAVPQEWWPTEEDDALVGAVLWQLVRALCGEPQLNGHLLDGTFAPAEHVDLGLSVMRSSGGLAHPTIPAADQLGRDEFADAVDDAVAHARKGRLPPALVGQPSITVACFDNGGDLAHGVIRPPEVAHISIGRPHERAWASSGMLGVRTVVSVSVAGDHRVSDPPTAGRLLATLARRMGPGALPSAQA